MKLLSLLFTLGATVSGVLANSYQEACEGKSTGDTCTYARPDGSSETGVCFEPLSSSACGPDYADGSKKCIMCGESDSNNDAGGDNTEPEVKQNAAVTACTNKDESDSCAFTSPDGTKIVGVCSDEGAGACGPDWDTSIACYVCSNDDTADNGGDSGVIQTNECDNKKIGDSCTVERSSGDKAGICADTGENSDTGDGQLSCQPADTNTAPPSEATIADDQPISSAITDACSSSSSGDSCSYKDPDGNSITGTCESNNGGT